MYDHGYWRRAIDSNGKHFVRGDLIFYGGNALIELHNSAPNNTTVPDYPEDPHIVIDRGMIAVHYSYMNDKGNSVDYSITISRSTGRFTETFRSPSFDTFHESGSCLIVKP